MGVPNSELDFLRVGVDVGGTNTDAVLMRGMDVLSTHKTPTTTDVDRGVVEAIMSVIGERPLAGRPIDAVMIGTTHFTNAVVQRRELLEVAVIRIGMPATRSLPPMVGWPDDLRRAVGDHAYMVAGGNDFNGRPISRLDEEELRRVAGDIRRKEIRSLAITAVFSSLTDTMERRAAEILHRELPTCCFSLSSEVGRAGLLERENATILNACLRELARDVIGAYRESLESGAITAPLYVSQNDGSLMTSGLRRALSGSDICLGPN